jgi:hypothetical protein
LEERIYRVRASLEQIHAGLVAAAALWGGREQGRSAATWGGREHGRWQRWKGMEGGGGWQLAECVEEKRDTPRMRASGVGISKCRCR